VIGFLTDFGSDSAAAICRGVMLGIVPDAQIVDIDHNVRKFAVGDGAFLLWATLPWLPVGTHLGVVDPGVGTARRPIALRVVRGDILVGPDNGLLMPAAERLGGVAEARSIDNAELMLERRSSTFHGRDVFAPVTAHLAAGSAFEAVGPAFDPGTVVGHDFPLATRDSDGALVADVLYVDSFGNVRLSATLADLPRRGDGGPATVFVVRGPTVTRRDDPASPNQFGGFQFERLFGELPLVRTFGEVPLGQPLLYEDSNGLLAIGVNQGDAASRLGLEAGMRARLAAPPEPRGT
jgi:hypothetical protein